MPGILLRTVASDKQGDMKHLMESHHIASSSQSGESHHLYSAKGLTEGYPVHPHLGS